MTVDFESTSLGSIPSKTYSFLKIFKNDFTCFTVSLELVVNKKGKKLSLRSIDNRLAELRSDFKAINNIDLVVKAKEMGVID